jgi:putative endonuclease
VVAVVEAVQDRVAAGDGGVGEADPGGAGAAEQELGAGRRGGGRREDEDREVAGGPDGAGRARLPALRRRRPAAVPVEVPHRWLKRLSAQVRDVSVLVRGRPRVEGGPMPATDPRHHLGRLGERLAAEHLERRGCSIVRRNHRTRFGEIDLIVLDGDILVFVEVKTRRGRGSPWDSLDDAKQAQVRRMARAYLAEEPDRPHTAGLRFDAIGVCIDGRGQLTELRHLEGAF